MDRNQQLVAAKHWMEGKGLVMNEVDEANMNQTIYRPIEGWPPAYSFTLVPVYWLIGDWISAARLLHLLGVCWVFLAVEALLRLFQVSRRAYLLFFLFWAVSFTPFHYLMSSGMMALGAFLSGIWSILTSIQATTRQKQIGWIIISAVFFALGPWMRYAYYPLTGIGAILLLVLGLFYEKQYRLLGGLHLLVLVACLLPLWLFQQAQTGSATYVAEAERMSQSLIWENLLRFDAFPLKALFYVSIEGMIRKFGIEEIWIIIGLKASFLALSILILAPIFQTSWRINLLIFQKKLPFDPPQRILSLCYWMAAILILLNALMLVYLSLKYPLQEFDHGIVWTYVEETRYYAPSIVLIQLFLFIRLFHRPPKQWIRWLLAAILGMGILYSSLHAGYRNYVRWGKGEMRETLQSAENQRMLWVYEFIEQQEATVLYVHGEGLDEQNTSFLARLAGANTLSWARFQQDFSATAPQSYSLIIIHLKKATFPSNFPFSVKVLQEFDDSVLVSITGF